MRVLLRLRLSPAVPRHGPLRRQTRETPRVRRRGMRDRLRILDERVHVQIRDRVPSLVIVFVVRLARRAPEKHLFLGRLEALGSGEKATGGDADVLERRVVAPPVELRRHRLQPGVIFEIILEQLLGRGRPRRAGEVEGGAVAVVDAVFEVRACDHVVLEKA